MEIELKYAAPDAETLDALLTDQMLTAHFTEPVRLIEMQTTYYDTPARELRARRWTLRLRQENGTGVATCKDAGERNGALSCHGEWACEANEIGAAIPQLIQLGAPQELTDLCAAGLEVTCTAAFTRMAVILALTDGTKAELCCDLGVLKGSTEQEPLCEVELELTEGSVEAMQAFAEQLAERFALTPEPRSKLARALALK